MKINDMELDEFLARSVDIDPLRIDHEFQQISGQVYYWGAKYADAHKAHALSVIGRKRIAGELWLRFKGEQGMRLDDLKAAVDTALAYTEAQALEADAEAELKQVQAVVEALRTKRDMLVQMGAQVRAEMQSDPMLRHEIQAKRAREGT